MVPINCTTVQLPFLVYRAIFRGLCRGRVYGKVCGVVDVRDVEGRVGVVRSLDELFKF